MNIRTNTATIRQINTWNDREIVYNADTILGELQLIPSDLRHVHVLLFWLNIFNIIIYSYQGRNISPVWNALDEHKSNVVSWILDTAWSGHT